MNIILLFISIILTFSAILILKKFFGKIGIIGFMGIATILANILTCKNINIFNLNTTLGTILFASNFLATDILTECYSLKAAKQGILFSLCSCIGFIIVTQIALLFTPNEYDIAQPAFLTLFTLTPRITIASLVMYVIANYCDVYLYNFIAVKTHNKYIWLRNNISTIICNGLENFIFYFLAFYNIYDITIILTIALTSTIIETIIAVCDTPFLYLATKIKSKE